MNSKLVAEILIFRGVPTPFSYEIPETLVSLKVGDHVIVPFGRLKIEGLILSIQEKMSDKNLKEISEKNEKKPCLPKDLIHLILWFSTYYQCHLYKAYQTVFGQKKIRDISLDFTPESICLPDYSLNKDQDEAIQRILNQKKAHTFLIQGITGSGKTEIYMRLAQEMREQGLQTIILVPEIALTPQYTLLFNTRFKNGISILHSQLTPKQKEIEWAKINQHQVDIVIGPRSAIFSPTPKLGVIIIDEEHDNSYKQESSPRYLTHHVAEFRSKYLNIPLVLGSATPNLTTVHAPEGRTIIPLLHRATGQILPDVKVIDMCQEYSDASLPMFSNHLIQQIESRLEKKEKVMILMNRRGYAPTIICQKCKEIHACPQCGLSYTYHKNRAFRCHRCDLSSTLTNTCQSCGCDRLAFSGLGIQKVETELQQYFPEARILRMDKDTTKTAKQLDTLLNTFKAEGDVLIGTQMIAKGHDILDVTLVGVLGIDTLLNMPDFRSPERTFQMLTQVAGRAGRGSKKGDVVIQTLQPEHYAIIHAQTHNTNAFLQEEKKYRDMLKYPPFQKLINIIISSQDTKALQTYAFILKTHLKGCTEVKDYEIIGPSPAPIERVKNYSRWHVMIKTPLESEAAIKQHLLTLPPPPKNIRLIKDFDPQQVL